MSHFKILKSSSGLCKYHHLPNLSIDVLHPGDTDLVELPVEGRHGGADSSAGVAAEVPLHVVKAVGQSVQGLYCRGEYSSKIFSKEKKSGI